MLFDGTRFLYSSRVEDKLFNSKGWSVIDANFVTFSTQLNSSDEKNKG